MSVIIIVLEKAGGAPVSTVYFPSLCLHPHIPINAALKYLRMHEEAVEILTAAQAAIISPTQWPHRATLLQSNETP